MANTPTDNPVSEQYRQLQIDAKPVAKKRELLDYKQLLKDYYEEHNTVLKPAALFTSTI